MDGGLIDELRPGSIKMIMNKTICSAFFYNNSVLCQTTIGGFL